MGLTIFGGLRGEEPNHSQYMFQMLVHLLPVCEEVVASVPLPLDATTLGVFSFLFLCSPRCVCEPIWDV